MAPGATPGSALTVNPRVGLCFAYFFLVMASYYTLKPVREAFFLDSEGVGNFPKVHILLVAVTYLAAQAYDRLGRKFRGGWLAVRATPLFALCILIFWAFLQSATPATPLYRSLVWLYYLGVSVYVVFVVAFFWSLTHSAFTPEDGKKHYGVIGLGGILGGAAGGILTRWLVPHLGSVHLLWVSASLLLPCGLLGWMLDERRLPETVRARHLARSQSTASLKLLFESRYVGAMAALIFFVLAFEELGDHQTQRLLEEFGLKGDALTLFYGQLYSVTNSLGAIISLLVTRWVLTRWGPGPGLWLLPVSAVIKAVAVLIWPDPRVLMWTLGLELALHYSIFQASKELLYTPTSDEVRFRAKTMIDTFVFRLGAGLAALFVLLFLLETSQVVLSILICLTVILAIAVALWLSAEFEKLNAQAGQPPGRDAPSPG